MYIYTHTRYDGELEAKWSAEHPARHHHSVEGHPVVPPRLSVTLGVVQLHLGLSHEEARALLTLLESALRDCTSDCP